jgi:exodeoxyribonuclease (lambda-induced)
MSALQGTEEWKADRVGMITASRVGAILDNNPHQSRDDTMREMVREALGLEREFQGNVATAWGNDHEDTAIDAYETRYCRLVISDGFVRHPSIEYLGCSPDGLIGDDALIEVKCPYGKKLFPIKDKPYYYDQVQLQLEVTNREVCDFVVWTPDDMSVEKIERSPKWFLLAWPILEEFYQEFKAVMADKDLQQPYAEPKEVQRKDADWLSATNTYRSLQAQLTGIKDQVDAAKKELVKLAGDKKSRGNGYLVYPVERKGVIQYAKAIKDLNIDADFEMYRGKSSTSWTVKEV